MIPDGAIEDAAADELVAALGVPDQAHEGLLVGRVAPIAAVGLRQDDDDGPAPVGLRDDADGDVLLAPLGVHDGAADHVRAQALRVGVRAGIGTASLTTPPPG